MSGAAAANGSPPTAGVGCSIPASSTALTGRASCARIGVARCWMLAIRATTGSSAAVTHTLTGRSARTMRRVTIACSSRSLSERSSCSPRWSSTAGSALRRVEPASASVPARRPSRRTSSSGLAATNALSPRPAQKVKHDGNASRSTPSTAAGSCARGAWTCTSRARTILSSAPARMRSTARATADS